MFYDKMKRAGGEQEDTGLAHGEPPVGVGQGGLRLPAHLTVTIWTILCWASLS
jgi:hypothetical protein